MKAPTPLRVGSAAIAAFLVVAPPALANDQLKLAVGKTRAEVGPTQCFSVVVTNRHDRPVRHARVTLDDKRKRTDSRGRASVCNKFLYGGSHAIHAMKGRDTAFKRIIARRARPGSGGGSWRRIEVQFPAYPAARSALYAHCIQDKFGDGPGVCSSSPNLGVNSVMFTHGWPTTVSWNAPRPAIDIKFANLDPKGLRKHVMSGWVSWAGSGHYYVSDAYDTGWPTDVGPQDAHRYQGGSDPTKAGDPGGPLLISVTAHRSTFGGHDGYTFHVAGWLWEAG